MTIFYCGVLNFYGHWEMISAPNVVVPCFQIVILTLSQIDPLGLISSFYSEEISIRCSSIYFLNKLFLRWVKSSIAKVDSTSIIASCIEPVVSCGWSLEIPLIYVSIATILNIIRGFQIHCKHVCIIGRCHHIVIVQIVGGIEKSPSKSMLARIIPRSWGCTFCSCNAWEIVKIRCVLFLNGTRNSINKNIDILRSESVPHYFY